MYLTRIVFPGGTEALLAQIADRQLRQRAEIKHGFSREGTQLGGEHFCVILVGTHNAGEMFAVKGTVECDNRERVVRPALIERMLRRQRGRDNDRINLTLQQMLNAAHLVIRLIFRAGNQQLIAALARLTLKIVGDAGIAGVFQIRDN